MAYHRRQATSTEGVLGSVAADRNVVSGLSLTAM
jgi:hypothetical protein